MSRQRRIPAVFMRGGTSKALVFKRADLPADTQQWPAIFLAAMGSPDPYGRQLDGLGGGLSSLSKVCVIGPPSRPDADIDYTFFQISVYGTEVDDSGNCGNMSAAVGPYAYDEGMVAGTRDGECLVRIHNTNSGKLIHARFQVANGESCVAGDTTITGLAQRGAPVRLSFLQPGNTQGRGLLPAGAAVSTLTDPQGRPIPATLIDAAIPSVFVRASDLGVDGSISPEAMEQHPDLLHTLAHLRAQGSVHMGIAPDLAQAHRMLAIPKICMIAPAAPYVALNGQSITADETDLLVRMISAGQPHRAAPITASLATAAAAATPGSLVQTLLSPQADLQALRLGTPSGAVVVGATLAAAPAAPSITAAHLIRTQRRLMEGVICLPPSLDDPS